MKWVQVPLAVEYGHKPVMVAQVRECPDCGRREWLVFRVLGLERQYLQCAQCDRIETADGLESDTIADYAVAINAGDAVVHPLTVPGKEVAP